MTNRSLKNTLFRFSQVVVLLIIFLVFTAMGTLVAQQEVEPDSPESAGNSTTLPAPAHTIYLKSREFQPVLPDVSALSQLAITDREKTHILVQLDFIPRDLAKNTLQAQDLNLLAYVPDYAWIAAVPAADPAQILNIPGVVWAGELTPADKLDPAIQANTWSAFNRSADGKTVAVYVTMHKDESLDTGKSLVAGLGGKVTGLVYGINLLMAELPQQAIEKLAAADAVQWIEPAAPPLDEANDGIRGQIGVDVVNSSPYNLDGTGIDVMVYDGGRAGSHTDFGTRLTSGDAASFSEHATHVAGTVGGSGANSAAQGGTALQWRGMAPNVDLITYGIGSISGIAFYEDVSDIETDWAAGQNTYGADIGTASLSSNIYANYPSRCDLMGNYGATAVLIDQIVRGGNSVVGIGDKYIATWAAGNERGWASSCGTYNIISPPSSAKNPIQVGGSNTNNNTQYAHTSWGPTDDGRIKPIVTAGACQTSGDGGITSTDNSPLNTYTVKCGTSMATPAVAGSLALMLQQYREVYGTSGNFWPATAKAILMQTAVDLGNPGPDYQWGFGQVDIHAAVDLITRKAFRQESLAQGEIDLYHFIVGQDTGTIQVTLAWDDFEGTFNANPTLINNLNLELVSPSGTVWRPWVLNPASPASNATRGVDNVNNQEQVEIPSPEVGTWMVRVRGATVPQGPQDYALVCEGCQPLDVGVCQAEVDGTAVTTLSDENNLVNPEDGESDVPAPEEITAPLTTGEIWQQSLEAAALADKEASLQASLAMVSAARETGPEAVAALADVLRGPALDIAMPEIEEAQALLFASAPPPETGPISPDEETSARTAQASMEATNRVQAFTSLADPAENHTDALPIAQPAVLPSSTAADLTVGNGCTYPTIADAITAANPNDRLLIEGGVTFTENIIIDKNLTLSGGYNGCTSASTAHTLIDGSASGSVIAAAAGTNVILQNLNITNGSAGSEGGGIRFGLGTGTGTLTLTNVDVYANNSVWGGGIWLGPDTNLSASNVNIFNNTASAYGGGLRLFGGQATFNDSNIYNNSAPAGGGVYGSQETGFSPALNLPSSSDVYDNEALTGNGLGGGIYLRQGTMTAANCSDIHSNDAIDGGGAYVITSTIIINGSCSEIQYNTATGNGGGVYAQGSTINLDDDAELYDNDAGTDTTGSGGGAYLDNSNLYSDKASIRYNNTDDYGAGIYATNGSIVDMDLGSYTCVGERCSRIYGNIAATAYGGGIYANDSAVWLDNIFIENNGATLGGAIYATNSSMYIYNSLFARNNATSTAADAIRLFTSATMGGRGNTFAYNDIGGASTGEAINVFSADLILQCSIVWGHSSSISPTGLDVSYSDIQGSYTGVGNLDVNPLFVASGSYDYHLQSSSPAIDHCPYFSGLATDFDNEVRPVVRVTGATPYDMGADEVTQDRVGVNGTCTYGTIQQAVNAASNGDIVQIASGVYFETVDITNKNINLVGGYDSTCTSITGDPTRLEGSIGAGSTLDIFGSTVTLQNLEIAWGSSVGGGVDARSGAQVTLDNTDVFNNHGSSGGGIYVSSNSMVTTINNSEVHNNTASTIGGGVGVWGQFSGNGNYSDIYENCAPHGGGFYVPGGSLNINSADTYLNQAAAANGLGGGIYLTNSGVVTLTNGAYVYYLNQAYDGAGIYADNARVYLNGGATTLRDNVAANDGGAVYLTNGSTLQSSGARIGQAGSSLANESQNGAGIYALNSTVDFNGGYIINNIAAVNGGGIFADNSTILLTGVQVGDTAADYANQLGSSGHYGAGLYLTGATQATLDNTVVAGNMFQTTGFTYGGGAYVSNSSVLSLTNNSRIQEHIAPSVTDGRGAGIYINNGTVTIDNSQVISNTAGAVGGGIRMLGTSTLTVTNSSAVSHNESSNGEGGGIAAGGVPDINMNNVTLQHNRAGTNGGAIYLNAGTLYFGGWWDLRWNEANGNGGAVAIAGSADVDLRVTDAASYLAENHADSNGGAIYVTNNDTVSLYANDGYLLNLNTNTAGGDGAALYANNGAYFDIYGKVRATANIAGGNGGVLYLSGGSRVWLDDYMSDKAEVWINRANEGGAIYAIDGAEVACDGTEFGGDANGNMAMGGSGGAIFLDNSAFSAENCTFQNNAAVQHGGAIAAHNGSSLSIDANYMNPPTPIQANERTWNSPTAQTATLCNPLTNQCSNFHNNTADNNADNDGNGGAVYVFNSTLNLNNTYLHRNSGFLGGAIYQSGSTAAADVTNSLIYSNSISGAAGAGIRVNSGVFTVTHVTLAHNVGAGYSAATGTTNRVYNSISWGNMGDGFEGAFAATNCNIDQSGTVGAAVNPQFVAPGSGEDYHISSGSTAVDACATGLATDLDNIMRPVDNGYDMGAFEYLSQESYVYLPMIRK